MENETKRIHTPDPPYELEYVLFSCLKTTQEEIGQPGLDKYSEKDNNGLKLPPIEVLPMEDCNYLIQDGNHRARYFYDKGQPGLWAYVLLDRNRTLSGVPKDIEDIPIVPYEVSDSPSPNYVFM